MASYNPNPNLYNPRVAPDTQGLGPGIAAAGNAFAGALQTYGQNKRQDARRAEDRQWQQQDHQMLREEQMADYGMRRADSKADKEAEREQKLADEIAHYGVTAALYAKEGFADKGMLEWAESQPREKQPAALEAIVGQASYKAQQELKKKMGSEWSPVKQDPEHYVQNGLNQLLPPARQEGRQLTEEDFNRLGMKPTEVRQNGMTWRVPTPLQDAGGSIQTDKDGNLVLVDRRNGTSRPVVQTSTAPKTAKSYYDQ